MKKLLLVSLVLALFAVFIQQTSAQVGINTDGSSPDSSAILDVKSFNKGILPPRVALVTILQPTPVINPKPGLFVYNTATSGQVPYDVSPGYYCWEGNQWKQVMLRNGSNPGELVYWDGHQYVGLPAGQPGEVLIMGNDGIPTWVLFGNNHSPTVMTLEPSSITQISFVAGGNVISDGGVAVSERGICYSRTPNPSITNFKILSGMGTGSFSVTVTGLAFNTLYYFKAYAINSFDTVYGDQKTVETLPLAAPTITTNSSVTNITSTTASSGGNVLSDGGSGVFFKGVCWDTLPMPTILNNRTDNGGGTGSFISTLTNLLERKTYYVRAFARNDIGLSYGDTVSFTTFCSNALSPGVTIFTPDNPVCNNSTATFTAIPVNGGNNPFYQWKVNGINQGVNNPEFSYVPNNGDLVVCKMSTNDLCSNGDTATSNTIIMVVQPQEQPGISIVSSTNSVCKGINVIFTASVTNGGISPSYQWKVNDLNVGVSSPSFSYTPDSADVVKCLLTSNANCISLTQVVSNIIEMTVIDLIPVGVSIEVSSNQICTGIPVTFIASPVNGGSNPVYQWKKNGISISGATNSAYTYSPENNDAITCTLTSNANCPSGNPATSNTINMDVYPFLPVTVTIAATSNNVCAGTSVTFHATPVNGGTNPAYQWKKNGTIIYGATNSNYTCVPENSDVFICQLTSDIPCQSGGPSLSNSIVMTVNPLVPVSISIAASANQICTGTSVTFTANPNNGGTTVSYQWKKGGIIISGATNISYSMVPVNGDVITCVITANATCITGSPATSNAITMTVNPLLPVSVSIAAAANNVCSGTSVTFTATPTNGGLTPAYQWKKAGTAITGATNVTYSYVPLNGDVITCALTSSETCKSGSPATSNAITMIVNPLLPVSISIAASANNVCAGTSVTFTATPTNGGLTPVYQWKKAGTAITGATNVTYSYVPVSGDVITCALASSETCKSGSPATSNAITMAVNPLLPVSISIAASANNVCQGNSVTFTATPTNGGLAPAYQWMKAGTAITGATNVTYNYVPVSGDVITCALASSETCKSGSPATSNAITMTVNPLLPVSVSIAASSNTVCAGTSVTFTATPTNGGLTPAYQWKKAGSTIPGATNATYSYIPVNGDVITCALTSGETCKSGSPATSNAITMTVNPLLPVSVSIATSANNVCSGTSVTFTATPANGGLTPAYQWKKAGTAITGATNVTYSYVPLNGDVITCAMTSSETCKSGSPATSNAITMTVNPLLPVSVSIAASASNVCAGTSVTFTATPVNGGLTPAYQWKKSGTAITGATNVTYSYIPVNGDVITCVLISSETCKSGSPATSNAITMTVNPLLPVSISIAASANNVCAGTSVTFTATPTNGGLTPAYQWKKAGSTIPGATNVTYSYIPVNGDVITCALTSGETCKSGSPATSNAITMTVNPLLPVSVSITASANIVCAGTSVTFTAFPTNGGTTPVFQWKKNGASILGATNSSYSYNPQNNEAISCALTSSLPCSAGNPAISNEITIVVNPLLPVSISITASANPVCPGTLVQFTSASLNQGLMPLYQWTNNGTYISGATNDTYNYIPANNDAIRCVMTSNAVCPSGNPATSNAIVMSVSSSLPVSVSITASSNPVCSGTSVTFSAVAVNGGPNPSYQWRKNGNLVQGATNSTFNNFPVNNDLITCALVSNATCQSGASAISNTIEMTVNPLKNVIAIITPSANSVCAGASVSFTATVTNGGTAPSYQWMVNGTDSGTNSLVFTYIPSNNDVVNCVVTSNEICTVSSTAISNFVTTTVNPLIPVSISISASANSVCAGTTVSYIATPVNGGNSPIYKWKVNGVIAGTNSSVFSYNPVNNDVVNCVLTSDANCASGSPAQSNNITMVTQVPQTVSVSVTPSANPVCSGTTVSYIASFSNGGGNPSYQWKVNGINQGTSPIFMYSPINNDQVTCQLTSDQSCITGNPALSAPVTMVVNPILPVEVTVTANTNPVCMGTSVTFTATPYNQGSIPTFKWKVNSNFITGATNSTYSYVPFNNDNVSCVLTSNALCTTLNPANSNVVVMAVNPPLNVGSITGEQTVCAGAMPLSLISIPPANGTNFTYQWQKSLDNTIFANIVGATTINYQPAPLNVTTSYRQLQNADGTCGGPKPTNVVTVSVNQPVPVSVSISANPAGVTYVGTPVTFTALSVNGGSSPVYIWKVNDTVRGSNSPTFIYVPRNNDIVYCQLNSILSCVSGNPAISNAITVIVSNDPLLPVTVSITADQSFPVCSGIPVTYTAIAGNGGINPAFQWKVNGQNVGNNSATFIYQPENGDLINCILTSSLVLVTGNPATSNVIQAEVNQNQPVSVSISASANQVCAGTSVTFSATVVNGGTAPSYQWIVNGVNFGSNNAVFSYTPLNNDIVKCVVASDLQCTSGNPATSDTIIISVNPLLPVSISITASNDTVCAGTAVTYYANAINGGTSPEYHWKVKGVNAGTNQPTFTYFPNNYDSVTCVLISKENCVSALSALSNTIGMTVYPNMPVSISITASSTAVCEGTIVDFTSEINNAGNSPVYQWKVNGNNTGIASSTFSYIPTNNNAVSCELMANVRCPVENPVSSNIIDITVHPVLPVSVSISASANPTCTGNSVDFNASVTNGGSSPVYQWKVNGVNAGSNNPNYTYYPGNNNIVSCLVTSNLICADNNPATSNNITMQVNPVLPVSVSISASTNNVCAGTQVTFTAAPVNGGLTPTYQWKKSGANIPGATNVTYNYVPVNGDVISCVLASSETCKSGSPATSNAITMTVNPSPPASVSIDASANVVCYGTSVVCTATPVNGGTLPTYNWKVNGTTVPGATNATFTNTPVSTCTITCQMTSNLQCASGNPAISNEENITVNPILPVSVAISASPSGAVCQGTSVTFTAVPTNGGLNPAYQWKVNGVNRSGATNATLSYAPANGDVVSCLLTSTASCTSGNPATSNAITINVNPSQAVSVAVWASSYSVMPGTTVIYKAAPVNGGATPVYQWKVNNVVVGTNSNTYSYAPSNNDNILCKVTSNQTGCLSNNPATSNTVNMVVYTTGTPCTGLPTVVYGGKTYNTVQIGSQCWFRENLNIGNRVNAGVSQTNNSVIEKYCYNNDTNRCNVYGGLYQWAEMVQYLNGVTNTTHWNPLPTGNVQGICPVGWHVPSLGEAQALMASLGGASLAGGAIKEIGLVHWGPLSNIGATNSSGFTALPSGSQLNGSFSNLRYYFNMWTTYSGSYPDAAYYIGAEYGSSENISGQSVKITGDAVRCIKN